MNRVLVAAVVSLCVSSVYAQPSVRGRDFGSAIIAPNDTQMSSFRAAVVKYYTEADCAEDEFEIRKATDLFDVEYLVLERDLVDDKLKPHEYQQKRKRLNEKYIQVVQDRFGSKPRFNELLNCCRLESRNFSAIESSSPIRSKKERPKVADIADQLDKVELQTLFGEPWKKRKRGNRRRPHITYQGLTHEEVKKQLVLADRELRTYRMTHAQQSHRVHDELIVTCRMHLKLFRELAYGMGIDHTEEDSFLKPNYHDLSKGLICGHIEEVIDDDTFKLRPKYGGLPIIAHVYKPKKGTGAILKNLQGTEVRGNCLLPTSAKTKGLIKKKTPPRGIVVFDLAPTSQTSGIGNLLNPKQ